MSSPFDDLARTLATPLPRRRALRLLGGAVVVAVLPGLRARPALASRTGLQCPPPTTLCSNGKGSEVCLDVGETCCIYPEAIVRCKVGTRCGGSINNACVDACSTRCKDGTCCPRSKGRCVNGTCCPAIRTTTRPGSNGKGVACCPTGTIAVPGGTGLCCPKGKPRCCDTYDRRIDDGEELARLGVKRGYLCVKGSQRRA